MSSFLLALDEMGTAGKDKRIHTVVPQQARSEGFPVFLFICLEPVASGNTEGAVDPVERWLGIPVSSTGGHCFSPFLFYASYIDVSIILPYTYPI